MPSKLNMAVFNVELECLLLAETWLGGDAPAAGACPVNRVFSRSCDYDAATLNFQPPPLSVTVHRAPGLCLSTFLVELSEFLTCIHAEYDSSILMGEFNTLVDSETDTDKVKEFLKFLQGMNFKLHVNKPTHNLEHTLDQMISFGLNTTVYFLMSFMLHCQLL